MNFRWEGVGFVHGVLNTDNMSIMGLTIDYGPFAFMEGYDPGQSIRVTFLLYADFTPNGSDYASRYAWKEQKEIIKWNLKKLSEALEPFVPREESALILSNFDAIYSEQRLKKMKSKFGLLTSNTSEI
jgi:uncharacterized protein YdiU (UPF0061 family)